MTRDQAYAQAVARWPSGAHVGLRHNGRGRRMTKVVGYWYPGVKGLWGYGPTWEAAFADFDRREKVAALSRDRSVALTR